jgi:hypothetical protein
LIPVFFATFDSRLGILERYQSQRSVRPPEEVREADSERQTRAPVEKQNGESPGNRPVHETGLQLAWRFSVYSGEPFDVRARSDEPLPRCRYGVLVVQASSPGLFQPFSQFTPGSTHACLNRAGGDL